MTSLRLSTLFTRGVPCTVSVQALQGVAANVNKVYYVNFVYISLASESCGDWESSIIL